MAKKPIGRRKGIVARSKEMGSKTGAVKLARKLSSGELRMTRFTTVPRMHAKKHR